MSGKDDTRTYLLGECVSFRKTSEKFGGLSNMAPGYPVRINSLRILSIEALYQACRFPHMPEVQRKIIGQQSPMTAKMVSKLYRGDSRPDWLKVRVKVMRWCLRMKLIQHWPKFSQLLLSTGECPIVEDSRKDDFWGAFPKEDGTLVGMNVLGRLLMELREAIKQGSELRRVEPPAMPNCLLFGEPLEVVDFRTDKNAPVDVEETTAEAIYNELTLPLFANTDEPAAPLTASNATPLPPERCNGMIEGLQPYPEYRESGQGWLGQIPRHWDVRRTKLILREVDSRTKTGKEQLLRVSQYTGVTERKSTDGDAPDTRASSLVGYKQVAPQDLVINIMLAWNGSMGVSRFSGIASPAYCVYRFRDDAFPWYFHNLFRTPLYKGRIKATSTGVVESRLRLYSDDLGRIEALLPPADEQAAIVRFLDHANRKIDGFIRAKRKLIALLGEQKQAIIHRAVTRGLNPNAPLKPSGIPWLGDIPKHWEIVRNMALFSHRVEPGAVGLPVLQVSLRSGITAEALDQFGRPKRLIADATKYKRIHKGDVAYNTMRMWQGAVGVSPEDGLVSPAYVVLKPRKGTCPEFYDFVFHTEVYKQQVNRQSTGIVSDRNRLYWDSFKQMANLKLPFNEQKQIVRFIAEETAALNTAIARTEREIALMQEYRTRLTADVVTGKLDIRPAASHLPDLPAESATQEVVKEIEETEL